MALKYVVTGDDDGLEGWTAATLAAALEGPLGDLGVGVECRPQQFAGGGLHGHVALFDAARFGDADLPPKLAGFADAEALEAHVDHLVERIVTG